MSQESFKPVEVKQQLTSPILRTVFGYREMIVKSFEMPEGELVTAAKAFLDLEIQRKRLVDFAKSRKLEGVRNGAQFQTVVTAQTNALSEVDSRGKFDALMVLKNTAETGRDLLSVANEYLRIKAELTVNDVEETVLHGHIPDGLYDTLRRPTARPDRLKGIEQGLVEGIQELPFVTEAEGFVDAQLDAASFACYKESLLAQFLYQKVAWDSADEVGRDVLTNRPAVSESATYDELVRRSRALAPGIAGWQKRGLMDFRPRISLNNDISNEAYMERMGRIIIEQGEHDPILQEYLQTKAQISGQVALNREGGKKLLALKRKFFDEAVKNFSATTELIHPDIEQQIRMLLIYALRSSDPVRNYFDDRTPLVREAGLPLAQSIPTLREFAYETGVYLKPLTDEMDKRLPAAIVEDPYEVVRLIEDALVEQRRERDKDFILELLKSEPKKAWFVEEALYVSSTLDAEGKYQQGNRGLGVRRAPEVVQVLIDYLNDLV